MALLLQLLAGAVLARVQPLALAVVDGLGRGGPTRSETDRRAVVSASPHHGAQTTKASLILSDSTRTWFTR